MYGRFIVVFLLGFSSGLPLMLSGSTLQAWFSSVGVSVLATGMLSLVGIPYVWRFLWAPLLDMFFWKRVGRRRTWLLASQLLLFLAFNAMAWCNPLQTPGVMALLALSIAFLSATQDIAIDAHRVEYLTVTDHGLGASLAVLGYRLGMLVSGGLALILAHYLGWSGTWRLMGVLMLPGMLTSLFAREPKVESTPQVCFSSMVAPLRELFERPGIVLLLAFIFCFKLGEAFTATSSGIVMPFLIQGLGFSLESIGYVNKILGVVAVIAGGLAAGVVLLRASLYKALMFFGVFQAVTNLLFLALAVIGKNMVLFAVAVVCDNLAVGMGTTALVALLMRLVHPQYTATQFSVLVAFSALPRIFSGPFAAVIQQLAGWTGVYAFAFVSAWAFVPLLMCLRPHVRESRYLNGTEGRNRTDTVSPPPDFESGASTSSATPAQACIITNVPHDTMGPSKYS